MSRQMVNYLLLLAFVASLGLLVALHRDPTQRNFEFLPSMVRSPAYDTFAPNPNFPDGKTLQLPEPGTIARGQVPFHYGPMIEDVLRAGDELHSPFATADAATRQHALQRGEFLFANFCQMCHGPQGKGDGPMVQHMTRRGAVPPNSLLADSTVKRADGELFHVLTYGQKNMPAQAVQLSPEDRWKVILYVRSLQEQARGTALQARPGRPGEPSSSQFAEGKRP